ncbi:chemotaxis protein methyltransferase CheR [Caldimonas brevitalea]|uniref:histidine kinase n=2 Tax=Caldimonas brevitalea TaxID=413882 RepID=A0A0G3BLW1_9BURK|nr:chemotaxis protein methyltransferase CheR [Caldimonas brevitalea]
MRRLLLERDWSHTPLGPVERWPRSLRTAVEVVLHSPVPIVMLWGQDGVMIYNDAYSEFAGGRHPQLFGSKVLEGWPEVADFNRRVMEVGLQGGTLSFRDQPLVLYRTGLPENVWLDLDYSPLFGDDGRPAGVLAIVVETTQRVLAEQQKAALLERAESTAKTLQLWFEQAPGFVALLRGPTHVFEMVNHAYRQLIGHRSLIGKPMREALPEMPAQGFEQLLDSVYRSGEPYVGRAMRLQVQREPHGPLAEAFVDFVYQPVFDADGAVTGIFVQGHEVTEQVRAVAALRESEERFRLAVESSSLGTFDCDFERESVLLSQRSRELFDVSGEVTPLATCMARIHPGDVAMVQDALAHARAGHREGRYNVRHRVVRNNGEVRWIDVAGRAQWRDGAGPTDAQAERMAGVLWDITEQQYLVETLRQADRRKDEFLATLAHELRNPIAPIRTAAHLLSKPSLGADQIAFCCDLIQRQSKTMALLLDDLLDVSRITSGKLTLRKAYVGIEAVVDAALETARPLLESKRHTLTVSMPEHAPQLDVDPLRVAQVLTNLLTNAAKYTDPGGSIRLEVALQDGRVEFRVIDNGVGIGADMLPSLFEMFHQAPGTLDRAQGGLGIGLALSRGLAELHGGTLDASSPGPGLGATFRLSLPVTAAAVPVTTAGAPGAPRGDAVAAPTRTRVVVADDNIDAAKTLALLLDLEGYEVHVAHDGMQAVELAARVRPQAAFLDIGMPKLDGYGAAAALRREAWGRDLLLVATTGWGQEDDRRRALAAGFDAHLTKPIDPDAAAALLAQAGTARQREAGPTRVPTPHLL